MTIELVDGHANKPHISGDDLGDFKAGILGNDGYVFNRANKLAATLNGSNSVTIATGSGILPNSGRHFRVTAPETLTITSGTQGQNRNDLCVVRASTSDDGTTVENAQLLILRGTPTSGSASDPATQEGDLVLYRFQLTGVSVADPIALFSVMVPYNKFRTSIDPDIETVSWGTSFVTFQRRAGSVVCAGQVDVTMNAWSNTRICNIPNAFKPTADRTVGNFSNNGTSGGMMHAYGASGDHPGELWAMPFAQAITSNAIVFNMSWV